MHNSKQVGPYQLAEKLGEGSFGKVYKGIHRITKHEVALKFISKKGTKEKDIDAIKTQNQILKKLTHENIIRFIDCLDIPTDLVIVLEYAGTTLQEVFEKRSKLSLDEIKDYSQQIFSAMFYLYQNRIAHRDLKPQNILINNGIIKLCDFGFAKQLSASTQFMNSVKGTPLYISPEIIKHEPYTDKVDVWSFGIIIYELFYGRSPFHDKTIERVINNIKYSKVRYPPSIPSQLKEILSGMLQKNPLTRFNWQELKQFSFFQKPKSLSQKYEKSEEMMKNLAESDNIDIKDEKENQVQQIKAHHLVKDDPRLAELKTVENDIKTGKGQILKAAKINMDLFQKLMAVLRSFLADEQIVEKQHLKTVFTIISYLVTKIKLTAAEDIQNDITKHKSLIFAVIKIAERTKDAPLIANQFVLIGFLLKNNFDSVSIDFDTDEDIVQLCVKQLKDPKSRDCFNHALRILGILANQAMVTLNHSKQFFLKIESSKVLSVIAETFEYNEQKALVLECLQKFIYSKQSQMPTKVDSSAQLRNSFQRMKQQIAIVLLQRNFLTYNPINVYPSNQTRESYAIICYECLKSSNLFRREFMKQQFWTDFASHKNLRIFSLAYDHICREKQNIALLASDVVNEKFIQVETSSKMQNVFLISRAAFNFGKKQSSQKKVEHAQSLLLNIAQLLSLDENVKIKACRQVEGFICYGQRIFENILGITFCNILNDKGINKQAVDLGIVQTIFKKLLFFKRPHQELRISLQIAARCIIVKQQVYKSDPIKMNQDKEGTQIVYNIFNHFIETDTFNVLKNANQIQFLKQLLICFSNFMKIYATVDQKGQIGMYRKAEDRELHTLLFSTGVLDAKILNFALHFLLKISSDKKYTEEVTDVIGINLPKMQKYLGLYIEEPELIICIIQAASLLIRKNQRYSDELKSFGIISYLPKYLESDNDNIVHHSLTLIGHLAKHSVFFFDEFDKYYIFRSMRESLKNLGYGNKNKVIKGLIYAIGNISFYSDRFQKEIKPLVGSLAGILNSQDSNLVTNSLSTISNLLRHSDSYIQCLVEHRIIKSVIQIVLASNNADTLMQLGLNLLKKALSHPKIFEYHRKQEFLNIYQQKSKLVGQEHEFMKKVRTL